MASVVSNSFNVSNGVNTVIADDKWNMPIEDFETYANELFNNSSSADRRLMVKSSGRLIYKSRFNDTVKNHVDVDDTVFIKNLV